MKAYRIPVEINNTDVEYAFIFTDSSIADGSYPGYSETGYGFDNADAILTWFDSALNSSLWRHAPQACYNGGYSQMAIEYLVPLIETYWGESVNFKRLPTLYTETATIASSAKINGESYLIDSNFIKGGATNESTEIMYGSPFSYTINAYGTANAMHFTFYVLPDEAIVNDKLELNTDMPYAVFNLRIYTGGNDWQLAAYIGLTSTVPQSWVDRYNGKTTTPEDTDPYTGGDGTDDESGTGGGGDGSDQDNYDPDSDPNPVPGLPSISAVDTGFITLYNPTAYELKQLASYMWSGLFDIDTYRRIMADPMDTILGLSIVPVNVPSAGSQAVTVGNIPTGISMVKAASQYVSLDCGTIKLSEKWHSYLDYSPYTKLNIFLPYIGAHELNIDEFQGTTLGVVYHIDVLSGACIAFITENGNVIAQYSGQCSVSIPVTSRDFTQTVMALGQLVAGGVSGGLGMIASGGLSAPVTAGMISGGVTAAANTANNVIANKPRVEKSGNMGGSGGLLGVQIPYIFLERPKLCIPSSQNRYTGYPSYITYTLSSLSGFTQVQDIRLDNIPCTDSERDEIMDLLRNGVIL